MSDIVNALKRMIPLGNIIDLRIIDRLQGGSDLHAPLLCGIQSIAGIRDAVTGFINSRAQHEPGASYNIYCGICQTTELEKDGRSHGQGEPYRGFRMFESVDDDV